MEINGKKIKEVLTKGFVLVTLTGTLTVSNPIKTSSDTTVVYAAQTIDEYREKILKKLNKVYKYYSKSYYSAKEYKKLTTKYNKGIKVINACTTKAKITDTYNKYKEALNDIKPSILIKYQQKLEKSLLKSYKSLISKNSYSDYNLSKLENIKDEGIEKIYSCKTKTKSKKAKNNCVNELKKVTTLLDQTRNYVVDYINNSKDLSSNEKIAIIEQINNLNHVEDIVSVGEEYGYVKIVDETITVEQIEEKIKQLVKKYPKYTEDEIRVLVATANMDFVKDEDIFTIFNVNNKEELEEKINQVDQLLMDIAHVINIEYKTRYFEENLYTIDMKKYKDIIWPNELIMKNDIKIHANYICELIKTFIENDYTEKEIEKMGVDSRKGTGIDAFYKFEVWFYEGYDISKIANPDHCYDKNKMIEVQDERLNGAAGYVINKVIYSALSDTMLDWRAKACVSSGGVNFSTGTIPIDMAKILENNQYIYDKIKVIKKIKR